MEMQRLQWSVSSETGERLSMLLFLDRPTKATNLHAYTYVRILVYLQVHACVLILVHAQINSGMHVQAVAGRSVYSSCCRG